MIKLEPSSIKTYDKKTSLYIPEKIDFEFEPIFFGKGKNTQRYDNPRLERFTKLEELMQGQFFIIAFNLTRVILY